MINKDIEEILKKYPYLSENLQNIRYPIRGISIKPLTKDICEGTDFSYDSGFNYFSSIQKINEVYVEHFDIWRDDEDRDTEIIVYLPEVRQC